MKKIKAQNQIANIEDIIADLQAEGVQLPDDFGTYTPAQIMAWASEMEEQVESGGKVLNNMQELADYQENLVTVQQGLDMAAKTKSFNLKKAQYEEVVAPEIQYDYGDDEEDHGPAEPGVVLVLLLLGLCDVYSDRVRRSAVVH